MGQLCLRYRGTSLDPHMKDGVWKALTLHKDEQNLALTVLFVPSSLDSAPPYRGTSLLRTPPPVGPYSSLMLRALW